MILNFGLKGLNSLSLLNSLKSTTPRLATTPHLTILQRTYSSTPIRFEQYPKHPKFIPKSEFPDYQTPNNYFPQRRDPYGKYDDRQNRRNLGEKIHPYHDLLDVWAPDFYDFHSDSVAFKQFITFFALLGTFAFTLWYFELNPEHPAVPRTYPYNGLAKDMGSRNAEEDDMFRVRADKGAPGS